MLDFPGKISGIVFTQGCAFRCGYCHNPGLIPLSRQPGAVAAAEVLNYLEEHRQILNGLCITGGEPTLQSGLIEFVKQIKDLGLAVKLDTNGLSPKIVSSLIEQKLVDYWAMDLKAPWKKYVAVIGAVNPRIIQRCRETFSLIQTSGIAHEFRTTVHPLAHQESDFFTMAGYLKEGENYFIQNIRFEKTLDPALPRQISFDVEMLVKNLQRVFPRINLGLR